VLLTLAGLPGSGTSTVAQLLAAELDLDHLDGGTAFRAMAAELGLSLPEFAARAEADDQIDRALDERLVARAREGGVVLESRLSGWLATRAELPALRVWIACDDAERARRVGGRDGHADQDALAHNRAREASERQRYLDYYGIDLLDLTIYDLVLDSEHRSPEDLVAEIVAAARSEHGS